MSATQSVAFSRTRPSDCSAFVARYQRLRPVRLRLNRELVSRLPRDVMDEGAKKLGFLRRGKYVFSNQDETAVLMDYCIYDVYRRGQNAVEQFVCDCPPEADTDEMECLRAMQNASFGLIMVLDREPGIGCYVRNLFTAETRLVVDMGFAASAVPGLVVATRLVDFGDYIATGGASLPMGLLPDDDVERFQRGFAKLGRPGNADPAALIRECLRRGASSHIVYQEVEGDPPPPTSRPNGASQAVAPPRIEQTRSGRRNKPAYKAVKPAEKRRCRCGSGKMFKNCCGKRQAGNS